MSNPSCAPRAFLHPFMISMSGVLAGCSISASCTSAERVLNSSEQQLMEAVCTACHTLAPVAAMRDGPTGWRTTVYRMIGLGAQVQDPTEIERIVMYLTDAYGPAAGVMKTGKLPPDSAIVSSGTSQDVDLPAGAGVDQVRAYCGACHDLGRIRATRREPSSWERYTQNMLARAGVPATANLSASIATYLTQHFGVAPSQR